MKRALVAGMFILCVAAPGKADQKLAPDLLLRKDRSALEIIVQFNSAPTEKKHNKIRGIGGQLKRDLSRVLNAAHYSIPADRIGELSNDPDVVYISPNRSLHASLDYANPAVNAGIAREYGWDGTGVGIALIDSGLEDRPDLNYSGTHSSTHGNRNAQSRILYSASFLPDTLSYSTETNDNYGHGTHVAGILAGNGAIFTIGAGHLDIWAALNDTDLVPAENGTALSPAAIYDPASGDVYVHNAPIAAWDSSPLWSRDVVWGAGVFVSADKNNVVWGSKSNVVWGSSTTQKFSSLWGSSVAWSDDAADSTVGMNRLIYGEN